MPVLIERLPFKKVLRFHHPTNPEVSDAEGPFLHTGRKEERGVGGAGRESRLFRICSIVKLISISCLSDVVVKWKNFDFEMGPRAQQKASLINYHLHEVYFNPCY